MSYILCVLAYRSSQYVISDYLSLRLCRHWKPKNKLTLKYYFSFWEVDIIEYISWQSNKYFRQRPWRVGAVFLLLLLLFCQEWMPSISSGAAGAAARGRKGFILCPRFMVIQTCSMSKGLIVASLCTHWACMHWLPNLRCCYDGAGSLVRLWRFCLLLEERRRKRQDRMRIKTKTECSICASPTVHVANENELFEWVKRQFANVYYACLQH